MGSPFWARWMHQAGTPVPAVPGLLWLCNPWEEQPRRGLSQLCAEQGQLQLHPWPPGPERGYRGPGEGPFLRNCSDRTEGVALG